MNCYCNKKCFNIFNMTNNTMVYTCNTLEVNVIPKTTQDWSVIKYERNKLINVNSNVLYHMVNLIYFLK